MIKFKEEKKGTLDKVFLVFVLRSSIGGLQLK